MIRTKIISSLEKCFLDTRLEDYNALEKASMLKNERYYFLYAFIAEDGDALRSLLHLSVKGIPAECVHVRNVENEPVLNPIFDGVYDDNYLRTTPGLYPDWLSELNYGGCVSVMKNQLHSAHIEIDPKGILTPGKYTVTVSLEAGADTVSENCFELTVIDAELPEQDMKVTQWFHCDSLANYYNCEVWSERHWEIVENFARTAARNGINLLLTPIFTPPLDTAVGGERRTNQLVDVTVTNGKYSFCFKKLDRWIDMCNRAGIKFFEISHLYTQWGARHAPKVMATVDGEYKRIFGWDTEATGEEYKTFLRMLLKRFLAHMKARGDDKRCLFHISDEPSAEQLESYKAAKANIADLLDGYTVMDALSNFEFYEKGVVTTPIPSNDHIEHFIEAKVPGLWTYYCCGQCVGVSNRLITMPLWRTRSIGMQFYKFNIVGFLQWGYNFYNNCSSVNTINPYSDASGEYWVPAGDPFSVYPAQDGTAIESIRIIAFFEALQDKRAMLLAEKFYGHDRVVSEIEKIIGEVKFSVCAKDAQTLLAVREKINLLIAEAVK